MPRSLKKGPYVHRSLLKKVEANLDSNKKKFSNKFIIERRK